MKSCFLICKSIYTLKVYSIHHTLSQNTNLKNILCGQNKRHKTCPLSGAPAHCSLTFNVRFIYELNHKLRLSKTAFGIFHFRFRSDKIKVYIFFQKNALTL